MVHALKLIVLFCMHKPEQHLQKCLNLSEKSYKKMQQNRRFSIERAGQTMPELLLAQGGTARDYSQARGNHINSRDRAWDDLPP